MDSTPKVGDIVLIDHDPHRTHLRVREVWPNPYSGAATLIIEPVDGGERSAVLAPDCRVLEAHPGGAR